MRKLHAMMLLAVLAALLLVAGCGGTGGNVAKVTQNETRSIAAQQVLLDKAEPLARPLDSSELRLQNLHYTASADPNKIWYVTLVALDGTPYAHFTTRGEPAPAADEVTNPVQQICASSDSNGKSQCDTIGLAEPNGIYQGTGDQTFIAASTTGAMLRFPCGCVVSDQPFSVTSPVRLALNESAPVSHTDTSKTRGGSVPTGTSTHR